MTKKTMKDIDIEISDKDPIFDADKTGFPVKEFMKTLDAIDWKLWEILQVLQKWDEEEDEEEESDD
tara:strand:+ start:263 stop:460 length:198 start_codon:yes stop_codon:yes gene_type:complete